MAEKEPCAVIGAGAWGTALAWSLQDSGSDVRMWAYEKDVVDEINKTHENKTFLPGTLLGEGLYASTSLEEVIDKRKIIFFVAPSQFMRGVMKELSLVMPDDAVVVLATKGIENETLAFPYDVAKDIFPDSVKLCALSGPTFARELVEKTPTAATIASGDDESAKRVQNALSSPYFRLYRSSDMVGVELGGAIKNVIAIASGISDGLNYGDNTRAAIITRGLAEMTRLGVVMGASEKTFFGLSGVGDLTLTCTGEKSRNHTVGMRIGRGETLDEIRNSMTAVAEGVQTSISVHNLAKKQKVEMPISSQVYRVLHENKDPKEAVEELMGRSLKAEF